MLRGSSLPGGAEPGVHRAPLGAVDLHALARGARAAARPLLPQRGLGHRLVLDHRGVAHRASRGAPRRRAAAAAGRARHAPGARARPGGRELPLRLGARHRPRRLDALRSHLRRGRHATSRRPAPPPPPPHLHTSTSTPPPAHLHLHLGLHLVLGLHLHQACGQQTRRPSSGCSAWEASPSARSRTRRTASSI